MSGESRAPERRRGLLRRELEAARGRWRVLGLDERFERAIVMAIPGPIALGGAAALRDPSLEVAARPISKGRFDLTEHAAFEPLRHDLHRGDRPRVRARCWWRSSAGRAWSWSG